MVDFHLQIHVLTRMLKNVSPFFINFQTMHISCFHISYITILLNMSFQIVWNLNCMFCYCAMNAKVSLSPAEKRSDYVIVGVCVCVCVSLCPQDISGSHQQNSTKYSGIIYRPISSNWLVFGKNVIKNGRMLTHSL